MPAVAVRLAALSMLLFLAASSRAQDAAVIEKQKKEAASSMKQAEVPNPITVETDDLILVTTLSEEKAKGLAEQLQKTYLSARKVLQFEATEKPWTGKLTVYFLTESKYFKNFMRSVIGESPRDTEYVITLKGDAPYVLDQADLSSPQFEPDEFGDACALVAAATFNAKVGTGSGVPDWARMGFGRAMSMRMEAPGSRRVSAYKSRTKAAVLGSSGKPGAVLADVWDSGSRDVATSFMDFLAFGPKAMDFPKALAALRGGENNAPPALPMSLEMALNWKAQELEFAWKKWVQSGR